MQTIGLVGLAGSGKDTVGLYLKQQYGFETVAFADAIKDCVAAIFMWDREALAGRTPETRAWREQIDQWWAEKLEIPHFTPRWAMTNFGTDLVRRYFHNDIWILNTERRIAQMGGKVAITDVRHTDEFRMMERIGGTKLRVKRGPEPKWVDTALLANRGCPISKEKMSQVHRVHDSEYRWVGEPIDAVIINDGSLDDLHKNVDKALNDLR